MSKNFNLLNSISCFCPTFGINWVDGVVRSPAFHQRGPGLISGLSYVVIPGFWICCLCTVVLREIFLRVLRFYSLTKNQDAIFDLLSFGVSPISRALVLGWKSLQLKQSYYYHHHYHYYYYRRYIDMLSANQNTEIFVLDVYDFMMNC